MVLGKRWLFSIGNGAEIQPLEKGRKCPDITRTCTFTCSIHIGPGMKLYVISYPLVITCFGCSKEPSQCNSSFECNIFDLVKKYNLFFLLHTLKYIRACL